MKVNTIRSIDMKRILRKQEGKDMPQNGKTTLDPFDDPKLDQTPKQLWEGFCKHLDVPDEPGRKILFMAGFSTGMGYLLRQMHKVHGRTFSEMSDMMKDPEK